MQVQQQIDSTPIATCPIAMSNRAFFECAVKTELVAGAFEQAVFRSLSDPSAISLSHGGYDWELAIDAHDLSRGDESPFLEDFQREVNELAARLSMSITGDRNERAVVETLGYEFRFTIVGYWNAGAGEDKVVEDPDMLRPCVNYGRHVRLKITYAI